MYIHKISVDGHPFFVEMPVILSVDDDEVNQAVIEALLESNGYTVVQAMDGEEALEYLSKNSLPDLMLLDVMMPNLSGYQVCEKVRQLYSFKLPIIMISAKVSSEDIIAGLACLSNDYVTKPFDKDELLARIESHVKLSQLMTTKETTKVFPIAKTTRDRVDQLYRKVLQIENQNELDYLEIRRKNKS